MTTKPSKNDVYQHITDQIISCIEAGTPKYEMPWNTSIAHCRPINVITNKYYQGVNILALWAAQMKHGYNTGAWGTYKQWRAVGANVRKGEKGTMVVFFQDSVRFGEHPETEEPLTRRFVLVKTSWVFHSDQVYGWNRPHLEAREDKTHELEQAERFVAHTKAKVLSGGLSACYQPKEDMIRMPHREYFVDTASSSATENYYATLFHELTHWTGHKDRLNRDLLIRFGTQAYAAEELIAEFGAAFLCADLGISPCPRTCHGIYIESWLRLLKSDKRALFTAASKAREAADYLAGLQPAILAEAA